MKPLETDLTIAVGPVTLPERLRRNEIIHRAEPFKVTVEEFDRWAESLEANVTSTLAENLSTMVPTERVIVYPWEMSSLADYSVRARFLEFGPSASGDVVLSAVWAVSSTGGTRIVALRKSVFREPRAGDDVLATVSAMSRALGQLSRQIAAEMSEAGGRVSR